jgi:hypothetical protein
VVEVVEEHNIQMDLVEVEQEVKNLCIFSVCGATGYPITVGAGGAGGPASNPSAGSVGTGSTIFSTITSAKGGGGGGTLDCNGNSRWFRWWRSILAGSIYRWNRKYSNQ